MGWPVIHQVTPHLCISDVYAAQDEKTLRKHRVTHVLSLLSFANIIVPTDVKHLKLDILDYPDENIIDEFRHTHAFIRDAVEQGGNCLIHCQAGISRSSTVLCAFLMSSEGLTRDEAFRLIKHRRRQVRPNEGFWEQLKVYEDCHYVPAKGKPPYDSWLARFYKWETKL
ncbi:hypothetical protein PYCC9005_001058 [Savitreella phatthalungensis]